MPELDAALACVRVGGAVRRAVAGVIAVLFVLVVSACSATSGAVPLGAAGSGFTLGATEPETQSPPPVPAPPEPPAAPAADRSVDETLYLQVLDQEHIPYASPDLAVDAGRAVCRFLETGGSMLDASTVVLEHTPLTAYQAGYMVGAAEGTLCPGAGA